MGRLLGGRHAGDENLLACSPGLAEVPATVELTSPAFAAGAPIPKRYTQEGDDRFPPLAWRGVPGSAQELVIVVEDPGARGASVRVSAVRAGAAAATGRAAHEKNAACCVVGRRRPGARGARRHLRAPLSPRDGPTARPTTCV